MIKKTILFDLGNTLVEYIPPGEFTPVLEESIRLVSDFLNGKGLLSVPEEEMWTRVERENHTAPDFRAIPLEDKLSRIFALDGMAEDDDLITTICRIFLKPIFAMAYLYPDVIPVIEELRGDGHKLGIVSNLPWGSPSDLWCEEVARHGLSERVDAVVFCRDAGWRKPARQIFDYTLDKLDAKPEDCVFIGDDPRWDIVGPRAIGMEAVLIDRSGKMAENEETPVRDLREFRQLLGAI